MTLEQTTMFYGAEDMPLGKDYRDWVVKWWQLYWSTDWRRKLTRDVFMVPGKIEKQDIKMRSFKIDRRKAILVPIINWLGFDLMQAKAKMDVVATDQFIVNLDGKNIADNYCRILTPFFQVFGKTRISDGYWLFFKPDSLKKGVHILDSSASCSSGQTQIAMNYRLDIT